jgi:hypothetical protein
MATIGGVGVADPGENPTLDIGTAKIKLDAADMVH